MAATDNYLPVTWGRALAVWWAFMWRTIALPIIISLLIGLIISAVTYISEGAANIVGNDVMVVIRAIISVLAVVVYIGIIMFGSLWVMKIVLRKKFKHFRIVLISDETIDNNEPVKGI